MLFHTSSFLFVFLPVVLAGWVALGAWSWRASIAWLAAASVVFYGMWAPEYVALLLASITVNYIGSLQLTRLHSRGRARAARWALALLVVFNLALLAYYKYANFFIAQIDLAFRLEWQVAAIVLPIGISFYTFTQIAYVVDTYQGKVQERNFVVYLLFVTYFPHLVAGPIIHHAEMVPQFLERSRSRFDSVAAAAGLTFLAFGLFKKIVLADGLAPVANASFDAPPGSLDAVYAWVGALAYTMQLYFDFSGYSDMAVGVSLLFNVRLPVNFWSPYRAVSIIDFWRRWHMTLSRFLRDYLYIPLGGNRKGPGRRAINLLATMTLGGLWHGANWTFVAWGVLHGLYLFVNHLWRRWAPVSRWGAPASHLLRVAGWALTFLCILVAWVFFRARDLPSSFAYLGNMVGLGAAPKLPSSMSDATAWLLAAACAIAWVAPNTNELMRYYFGAEDRKQDTSPMTWQPRFSWGIVVGLVLVVTMVAGVTSRNRLEFLYFQF